MKEFKDELTQRMIDFTREIGIPVIKTSLTRETFIPGIYIENGQMQVDEEKLLYPGDILHEAAHIALIPAHQRHLANDNVEKCPELDYAWEVESIAWSYAAAVHLDVPLEILFHPAGYKGNAAGLLLSYQMGVYPGLPALVNCGMTYLNTANTPEGEKPFPAMRRWLQN